MQSSVKQARAFLVSMVEVTVSSSFFASRAKMHGKLHSHEQSGVTARRQISPAADNAVGGGAYTQN
jgi:hypothetical protein